MSNTSVKELPCPEANDPKEEEGPDTIDRAFSAISEAALAAMEIADRLATKPKNKPKGDTSARVHQRQSK
jgi:hypothetical protein